MSNPDERKLKQKKEKKKKKKTVTTDKSKKKRSLPEDPHTQEELSDTKKASAEASTATDQPVKKKTKVAKQASPTAPSNDGSQQSEADRKRAKAWAKKKRLRANRQARKKAERAAAAAAAAVAPTANEAELKRAADNIARKHLKEQRKQQRKAMGKPGVHKAGEEQEEEEEEEEIDTNDPNALFYAKLRKQDRAKAGKRYGRCILFVGQLPYSATEDQVREHFQSQGIELKSVRMNTDKHTGKFRGTCFIELPSTRMQAIALRLHQTEFGTGPVKRLINVERTCGGGGKSAQRQSKLEEMRKVQGDRVLSETKAIIQKVLDASDNAVAKACQLDDRVIQSLCTFPRVVAQQVVEDFVGTVDEKVKKPNAWLMGTLKRYREGLANGEDLASLKVSDDANADHYRPGRKHQRKAGAGVKEFKYDGQVTSAGDRERKPSQDADADGVSTNSRRYGYISYTEDDE